MAATLTLVSPPHCRTHARTQNMHAASARCGHVMEAQAARARAHHQSVHCALVDGGVEGRVRVRCAKTRDICNFPCGCAAPALRVLSPMRACVGPLARSAGAERSAQRSAAAGAPLRTCDRARQSVPVLLAHLLNDNRRDVDVHDAPGVPVRHHVLHQRAVAVRERERAFGVAHSVRACRTRLLPQPTWSTCASRGT
jgi:hypothetical protein